jgi:hypothetical protein
MSAPVSPPPPADDPLAAAAAARTSRRVHRLILVIGAVATVGAFVRLGWRGALGMAIGALISLWNYGRLERLADAITRPFTATDPTSSAPPQAPAARRRRTRAVILTILRYALIVAVLYAIVKYLEVNVMAALLGLFTGTVAVFVNALFEYFES